MSQSPFGEFLNGGQSLSLLGIPLQPGELGVKAIPRTERHFILNLETFLLFPTLRKNQIYN